MTVTERILDEAPAFRLQISDAAVIVHRNHLATKLHNPEARGDWISATPLRRLIHGSRFTLNLTPHGTQAAPLPQ